jgi:hypothetical protein
VQTLKSNTYGAFPSKSSNARTPSRPPIGAADEKASRFLAYQSFETETLQFVWFQELADREISIHQPNLSTGSVGSGNSTAEASGGTQGPGRLNGDLSEQ